VKLYSNLWIFDKVTDKNKLAPFLWPMVYISKSSAFTQHKTRSSAISVNCRRWPRHYVTWNLVKC